MADTPFVGLQATKLYLVSGQFTTTIKDSENVSGVDTTPISITYDGTNSPWAGENADKLYLQSGQFTSTIKTSQAVGSIDVVVRGISWDGTDTPWTGSSDDKLYLQSGQFTSTLKTSQSVVSIDTLPTDISYGSGHTPWSGFTDVKLYLQSGQFTSTLKTSEYVNSIDTAPQSVSWDGTNSPWCGSTDVKLYLTSGQFTSTLKTSIDISSVDNIPLGICTNDVSARIGTPPTIWDTPWTGIQADKLYLQSGQFTSTVKTSEYVGGTGPYGITWDGNNTLWVERDADKLYLTSGQFSSTIKNSQDISGTTTNPTSISWDGTNTPWTSWIGDKLYLQSGQFTSTLKTSYNINSIDIAPTGISWDGVNTPWAGTQADKLYLQSGQFTSTLKTSQSISGVDDAIWGISWDGTNTPWAGNQTNKLYLTSGQFSSTLKTSEDVGGIDNTPTGICTNDISTRIGGAVFNRSITDTITFTQTATGDKLQPYYELSNSITFSQTVVVTQWPTYLTALNAVAFTQEAKIPDVLLAVASNSVTFTQTIARAGTEYIDAANSVTFIDQADAELNGASIFSRDVLHTIDFTQTAADTVPFKVATAISILTFTQSILVIFPRTVIASSFFEFLQFVNVNPKFLFAVSDLAEVTFFPPPDSEIVEPVVTGFQQIINLTQITGKSGESSRINFEQSASVVHIRDADGISKAATSTVTFTQTAQITYGSDSTITFAQTATADVCKPCKSILTFQQTVVLEAITTRAVTSNIEFEQSAFHSLTRAGVLCNTQNGVVPTLPHFNNVQFVYPITSPTHTLTLRGPELGNRERMQFQRINRETRGGTLVVFADPVWPKNDHLVMDYIGLTETETNQVRSFIRTTLGKQITFRDWEGRNWVGIIVSPDNPVVRDGALCMNTVTIELEGHAGYDVTASSTVTFTQTAVSTVI